MAKLPETFNAEEIIPGGGDSTSKFPASPPGGYLSKIIDSDIKPTKAGDGVYVRLTFEGLEGDAKGCKITEFLNIKNPSETAVQIGLSKLSAICRVCGVAAQDTEELHDIPLRLVTKIDPDSDKGYCKITHFLDENGNPPDGAPEDYYNPENHESKVEETEPETLEEEKPATKSFAKKGFTQNKGKKSPPAWGKKG